MKSTTIGIDLAKNLFQVHGVDRQGNVVLRKQLRREQVAPFFANLSVCLISMEAYGSAQLGTQAAGDGPYRQADGSPVRKALDEEQQERRGRR